MADQELRVHVRHLKESGYCDRGARVWFARYKLDFNSFCFEGLPISIVDKIGDPFSKKVTQIARDEYEQDQP